MLLAGLGAHQRLPHEVARRELRLRGAAGGPVPGVGLGLHPHESSLAPVLALLAALRSQQGLPQEVARGRRRLRWGAAGSVLEGRVLPRGPGHLHHEPTAAALPPSLPAPGGAGRWRLRRSAVGPVPDDGFFVPKLVPGDHVLVDSRLGAGPRGPAHEVAPRHHGLRRGASGRRSGLALVALPSGAIGGKVPVDARESGIHSRGHRTHQCWGAATASWLLGLGPDWPQA
mmetsp:Transcript_78689/g.222576  ORF Transcript_78689/g.222576 Transcript_78689/m.222576 type:complete len:229 (+) Transcript_78689:1049-1735(+)